ncbi:GNAT family N-acetyltransferase [Bacillus sp. RZ2MS9]|uniref:GNAT family N-acetyltransferase n=1 Tax=Bacillus sp. RZ2MS9 TaxID=1806216 RepID=UPI0008A50217|nr:GNAT family N-acetyltransferase [Bacillus sp. RZ2MS9]MEC3333269.1 GNAT family N-acetyltransferase [Bacillus cereus]QIZ45022.1 GNAT family N-acetyltransferase [Bacillus sp. RZ2MS9]
MKKLYSKIYGKFFLIINEYSLHIENYKITIDSGYTLKEMNKDILMELKKQYYNEIDQKKYEILLERLLNTYNEIGYVVVNKQEEICGYYHLVKNEMKSGGLGRRINLSNDTVVLFDDYTFLKHRGKGVHKYSIEARITKAQKMGFKKANVLVYEGNIPSEKAYTSFNFKKSIRYKVLKVLKRKFIFVKRLKNEY